MGRGTREVRQLLGPLDPARRGESVVEATDRQVDLQRIIATVDRREDRTGADPNRRRLVLAATAVVTVITALAVGVNLLGTAASPAFAVTPAPLAYERPANARPAPEVLHEIAAKAERSTDEPRGGDYEHLTMVSWDLWTQVGGERVTSAVVPARSESWRGPDDAGRIVSSHEAPDFRSDEDRRTWEQDGSPGADTKPETTDFPPGQFPAMWKEQPPADLAALKEWLAKGHPTENGPAEVIVAITDLARERILGPSPRANVLRVLAELPGLAYDGEVTDRAGRRGQAFSLESDHSGLPTRHTVIVEPATGRLLSYEQMLTKTAGELNVRVPAVIGYEIYVKPEYTDRPAGARPDTAKSSPSVSEPATEPESATPDPSPAATEVAVVPTVVGMNLRDARATMKAAGFSLVSGEDETGRDRPQGDGRDWAVTRQESEAGKTLPVSTRVVLYVTKYGE
jgi:hypothetical protein